MSPNRLAGIGIFVLGGVLLFAAGLFLIGDRRMLFSENFEVWSEFATVTGLQVGATVRVAGKDAGEVLEIAIPPDPESKFRVRMRLVEDLHQLVRTDSVASIQTDGLVGNKFLQISPGSNQAPTAPEGSTIRGQEPFDFADLMAQASETIQIVNATILDVKDELQTTLKATSETITQANEIITDAGTEIKGIADSGNKIAKDLNAIIASTRAGEGTVGKLLTDDSLYTSADLIFQDFRAAAENVRTATEQAKDTIAQFRQQSAGGFGQEAQGTLRNLNEILSDMAENTEALKRNWFFRGFFKDRGYYDLDDLTLADYKAGLLERGRFEKKVWMEAQHLFAQDQKGQMALTEEGKQRLSEAMSMLMKYPKNSVYMIEGYVSQGTSADQFVESRRRALAIRTFLTSQYPLRQEKVGIMPVGLKIDSITGEPWDGIALAVYYDQTAELASKQ